MTGRPGVSCVRSNRRWSFGGDDHGGTDIKFGRRWWTVEAVGDISGERFYWLRNWQDIKEEERIKHFDDTKHTRYDERWPGMWVCLECSGSR